MEYNKSYAWEKFIELNEYVRKEKKLKIIKLSIHPPKFKEQKTEHKVEGNKEVNETEYKYIKREDQQNP